MGAYYMGASFPGDDFDIEDEAVSSIIRILDIQDEVVHAAYAPYTGDLNFSEGAKIKMYIQHFPLWIDPIIFDRIKGSLVYFWYNELTREDLEGYATYLKELSPMSDDQIEADLKLRLLGGKKEFEIDFKQKYERTKQILIHSLFN
jgi:hypothetical protein